MKKMNKIFTSKKKTVALLKNSFSLKGIVLPKIFICVQLKEVWVCIVTTQNLTP